MAKNQVKAKQHTYAELLLFLNYSLSLSTLLLQNNEYSKKWAKASVSVLIRFITGYDENEAEKGK